MAAKAATPQIETACANRAQRRHPTPPPTDAAEGMPFGGLGRWRHIARFVGMSREKWRQLVLAGKAPQPIRMGDRVTLYEFTEIHRWLADPLGYSSTRISATAETSSESHVDAPSQSQTKNSRAKTTRAETIVGAEG